MDKTKKRRMVGIGIGAIAAIGLLAFAILFAFAASGSGSGTAIDRNADGNGDEVIIVASTVTPSINYQGRLTDSAGDPLSGTYTIAFKLYDVASGGTALDTDTHTVAVENGLFNTNIDFCQSYFDGRELWLGIKVGADAEMTPRQELRPVPYALSLRPGAVINGSVLGPVLEVKNTRFVGEGVYASTYGKHSEGVSARTYGDFSDGVSARTDGDNSDGVYAYTIGEDSDGVSAYTIGDSSCGVFARTNGDNSDGVSAHTSGDNSQGVYACTLGSHSQGVYAHTSGYDSPAVYGYSWQDVGVYGTGKEGGYFTTTTAGTRYNPLAGVHVSTAYSYNPGVRIETTGDHSDGVRAHTVGNNSEGVYVETTGDHSDGVRAHTVGDGSEGVYVDTSGGCSKGVFVYTSGRNSDGVLVATTGKDSAGVLVDTTGDGSEGVYACTSGRNSDGVFAYSAKSYGIYAGTGRSDHNYAFFTLDNILVGGKIDLVGTVDPIIVESFNADPAIDYEVGDVVCLDEDSGYVKPCLEADDTRAVGVVGPTLEIEDGEISVVIMGYRGAKPDEEHVEVLEKRQERAEARVAEVKQSENIEEKENLENEITMRRSQIEKAKSVTRQVVKVKVDASYGPIKIGDLLTTSPTKGRAVKAQPVDIGGVEIYRPGTIIGKAMEPLESGTGLIEVFVTLQ